MDVVRICREHGEKESNNSFYFHVLSYLENGSQLDSETMFTSFSPFLEEKKDFLKGQDWTAEVLILL